MRLSNYLRLAPSGIWHFRLRVPAELVERIGAKEFTQSLRTRDVLTAQQSALTLAQAYAQAITQARGLGVATDSKPNLDEVIRSSRRRRTYELELPNGTKLKTDGSQVEHDRAMEALKRIEKIGEFSKEAHARNLTAHATHTPESKIPALAIGKAVGQWLADIKSSTKAKTWSIKTTAVEGFARHYGEKKPLRDVGRIDVGQWVQSLRKKGLETPTIVNKCSYLRGFFDWAKARGYYPAFAKDENPAAGQIVFRTREKRARRAFGFKAFTDDQVGILFGTEALSKLSETATLGAWIGLYTGARVAEVGQLALKDFIEVEGIQCIKISDEGEGQSVKSDSSIRTIPIHPALIKLGLLKRVDVLRKAGETRFFPKVKVGGVNGAGNWLSKSFTRHIEANLKLPEKGKFGFHSLRKTVVQGLQTAGVPAEIRAAYVGHELDDEHHAAYSRKPTMAELLDAVSKLDWFKTKTMSA